MPQFRAKMDLVPGQQSNLWFEPTLLGTYEVACAEYCGTGHYAMRGVVVVDTQEDFNSQSHDLLESNLCIKELLGKYPGKVYCLEDDFDHKPYADVYDYDKSFTYKLKNIQDLFK